MKKDLPEIASNYEDLYKKFHEFQIINENDLWTSQQDELDAKVFDRKCRIHQNLLMRTEDYLKTLEEPSKAQLDFLHAARIYLLVWQADRYSCTGDSEENFFKPFMAALKSLKEDNISLHPDIYFYFLLNRMAALPRESPCCDFANPANVRVDFLQMLYMEYDFIGLLLKCASEKPKGAPFRLNLERAKLYKFCVTHSCSRSDLYYFLEDKINPEYEKAIQKNSDLFQNFIQKNLPGPDDAGDPENHIIYASMKLEFLKARITALSRVEILPGQGLAQYRKVEKLLRDLLETDIKNALEKHMQACIKIQETTWFSLQRQSVAVLDLVLQYVHKIWGGLKEAQRGAICLSCEKHLECLHFLHGLKKTALLHLKKQGFTLNADSGGTQSGEALQKAIMDHKQIKSEEASRKLFKAMESTEKPKARPVKSAPEKNAQEKPLVKATKPNPQEKNQKSEELLDAGYALFREKRYEEALALYDQAKTLAESCAVQDLIFKVEDCRAGLIAERLYLNLQKCQYQLTELAKYFNRDRLQSLQKSLAGTQESEELRKLYGIHAFFLSFESEKGELQAIGLEGAIHQIREMTATVNHSLQRLTRLTDEKRSRGKAQAAEIQKNGSCFFWEKEPLTPEFLQTRNLKKTAFFCDGQQIFRFNPGTMQIRKIGEVAGEGNDHGKLFREHFPEQKDLDSLNRQQQSLLREIKNRKNDPQLLSDCNSCLGLLRKNLENLDSIKYQKIRGNNNLMQKQITLPEAYQYVFKYFQPSALEVYMVGSAPTKLASGMSALPKTDLDLLFVNANENHLVRLGFKKNIHRPNLYTGLLQLPANASGEHPAIKVDITLVRNNRKDWMEQHAQTCDFTISSLILNATGMLVDPLGQGFQDLVLRKLVMIGNPEKRFNEDPVLFLRVINRILDGYNCPQGLELQTKKCSSKKIGEHQPHLNAYMQKILDHHATNAEGQKKVMQLLQDFDVLSKLFDMQAVKAENWEARARLELQTIISYTHPNSLFAGIARPVLSERQEQLLSEDSGNALRPGEG